MKAVPNSISTLVMAAGLIIFFNETALSGMLTGTVIDNVGFNPVPDVEVSLFRSNGAFAGIDTTNAGGIYSLTLNTGDYFATFSKENYADTTIYDITILPQWTTVIDLTYRFLQNCDYVPGDVNNDGVCNGFDFTYVVAWMKEGPPPPYECECTPGWFWWPAVDFTGSCSFNGLDISYMIAYFKIGLLEIIPCGSCPPINPESITK